MMVSRRIVLPGLLLVGWGAIISFITTLPNGFTDFRLPLRWEQSVYIVAFATYALYFVWLYMNHFPSIGAGPTRWVSQILEYAFVGLILTMYVSGASISTPGFLAPLSGLFSTVALPLQLHTYVAPFAAALAIVVAVIVIRDLIKGMRNITRYFLLAMVILTAAQGITGSFLLGTVTPIGPFGLVGFLSSGTDVAIRYTHDVDTALLASLSVGYVYLTLLGWALKKNLMSTAAPQSEARA